MHIQSIYFYVVLIFVHCFYIQFLLVIYWTGLWTMDLNHGQWTVDHGLRTVDHGLWT